MDSTSLHVTHIIKQPSQWTCDICKKTIENPKAWNLLIRNNDDYIDCMIVHCGACDEIAREDYWGYDYFPLIDLVPLTEEKKNQIAESYNGSPLQGALHETFKRLSIWGYEGMRNIKTT